MKIRYFFFVWLTVLNCWGILWAKNPEVKPGLTRERCARLGVLVLRMGNTACVPPADITLKTDYTNREPKLLKADIYGEDVDRLRQAIPTFPEYKPSRVPTMRDAYFRNISAPLREALLQGLTAKGYQVTDVFAAAGSWPKKLADSTMTEVLAAVRGQCDTLLVVHYLDRGDSFFNAVNVQRACHGFSAIGVAAAAFDVGSGEILMKYRGVLDLFNAMLGDPDIQNDPERRGQIAVTETRAAALKIFAGARSDRVLGYTLADDEVVALAVKYICQGLIFQDPLKNRVTWYGIVNLMP